ncbi:hypothetical protein HELRODRAFT_131097, partial [Helobdella robusta]|uniref:Chloride channel protein n=1 Tax=Helobdella robusta TaxID=6412 RepID=T1EHV3_HELRO
RHGDDWIFLTLLGIIMALLSFVMDILIERFHIARIWLYNMSSPNVYLQYFSWMIAPLILVLFSTGFTRIVSPQAIGSGIPEIKTIMRGVSMNEYLTFNTLLAKVIGLSTAVGSGLPIGKEGPFVHVASISAFLLAKLFPTFKLDFKNSTCNTEILAAACAVGVACTFAAPIGGVLFSIEVTASYFAVRNYWRGFYSAVCGAIVFRLLAIWFDDESTLTALFQTNLRQDVPFDPMEIVSFSIVGLALCGIGGSLLICAHKNLSLFISKKLEIANFIKDYCLVYPFFATFVMMSLLFPPGSGMFMVGLLTNNDAVNELFSNVTWLTRDADTYEEDRLLKLWRGPFNNVFLTLFIFIVTRFWMCVVSTSLPVPSGIFMPSFTLGAACGRLIGEILAWLFPNGIGGDMVVPGGYAIVGA